MLFKSKDAALLPVQSTEKLVLTDGPPTRTYGAKMAFLGEVVWMVILRNKPPEEMGAPSVKLVYCRLTEIRSKLMRREVWEDLLFVRRWQGCAEEGVVEVHDIVILEKLIYCSIWRRVWNLTFAV